MSLPASTPSPTITFCLQIRWLSTWTWVEISGSIDSDGHVSFDSTLTSDLPRGSFKDQRKLVLARENEELLRRCLADLFSGKLRNIGGEIVWSASPTAASETEEGTD